MLAISTVALLFGGDNIALVFGIGLFVILTIILALSVDRRFALWSGYVLLAGLAAGRLGYVVEHATSFAAAPARIFTMGQSGFSWLWAIPAVALVCALSIRTLRFGLWAAFALGLSLFAWNMVDQLTNPAHAMPLPKATLQRLGGGTLSFAHLPAEPAVINLWASWCAPCRRELPMLVKAAATDRKVTFLFVDEGEGGDKARAFLASNGLAPANVLLDPGFEVAKHYSTKGLPVTFFVGADGRLRTTHLGEISPAGLRENLAVLQVK